MCVCMKKKITAKHKITLRRRRQERNKTYARGVYDVYLRKVMSFR